MTSSDTESSRKLGFNNHFSGLTGKFLFLKPKATVVATAFRDERFCKARPRRFFCISDLFLENLVGRKSYLFIKDMPRKKLARTLPRLPGAPVFTARDHKTARLLEILRGIAVTNQTEQPQIFYPVRDAARHFKVPVSMVAQVYGRLEEEGLLVSVRGSKTLLQGLSAGRHFSVHGFVGVPAAVSSFVTFQDYRMFFIRIRRELRNRGFAVAMVLFEPGHVKTGRLLKRLAKHEFDTVLWYRPDIAFREVIAQLKDLGLQTIGISDGPSPAIRCRYEIRRETAIKTILQDWQRRSGVRKVIVARADGASTEKEKMLETLLEEEDLEACFLDAGSVRAADFLEACRQTKHCGVIFPSRAASLFAFRAPEGLMKLMTHCRVAFSGGPPSVPLAPVLDVPVDLVSVDWQLIAERIVGDLILKQAVDNSEGTVFHAEAVLHAPLSQYSQSL